MLHQFLARIARDYAYERTKPFAGSTFGNFVRHDIAIEAKKRLIFLPFDLEVKGSVGAGNWASIPWLGFFDPLITTSATKGFYVVYLINPQTEEIFLSLNQGTTEAYNQFGEPRGREALKRRGMDIQAAIPKFASQFDTSPIELSSNEALPLGYEAGHAFGTRYHASEIDEEAFFQDLETMLFAYEALIDSGWSNQSEISPSDEDLKGVMERRIYNLSRRIERASSVRPKVLKARGAICEACGLDPAKHLGFVGPRHKTPLDVHHIVPINTLREGETRRYRIPEDFLVLCPTCHRLIHQQPNPNDLDSLSARITFRHQ